MNKLQRDAERTIRQQQKYDKALAEIERLQSINREMYEALRNANKVLEFIRDKSGFPDGSIGKLECNKAIAVNNQTLANKGIK